MLAPQVARPTVRSTGRETTVAKWTRAYSLARAARIPTRGQALRGLTGPTLGAGLAAWQEPPGPVEVGPALEAPQQLSPCPYLSNIRAARASLPSGLQPLMDRGSSSRGTTNNSMWIVCSRAR